MGPTKDGSITQYYTTGTDLLGHTIYTGTESANGMMKGGRYIWRPFGDKTPSLIGSASPADEKKGAYEMVILSPRERLYNMDANGGSWVGDVTQMRQIVDTNYKPVTEDRPTRAGYTLKGWNTKPDGTGDDVSIKGSTLKDGQTVYAQWEKDAGNPIRATIKCATRSDNNVLCSIIAYYADAPERTRELTVSGSNTLAWSGDGGITGIRLDASGYAGDVSCVDHRGSANAQCYYVSVADKPTQNTYQAQMPTTGAPEGLTTVGIMALTVSLIGLTVVLTRRRS